MNNTPFKQATETKQYKTWKRIRKLRQSAASDGNYATADFMELLEKLITGEHLEKVTLKLSQLHISFEIKEVNITIPQ